MDVMGYQSEGVPRVTGAHRTPFNVQSFIIVTQMSEVEQPMHYVFCPLVKLTFKDLAKLTALAAIFKTKSYFI